MGERESNNEEEMKSAVNMELQALMEKHGISKEELVDIVSEVSNPEKDGQEEEGEGKLSELSKLAGEFWNKDSGMSWEQKVDKGKELSELAEELEVTLPQNTLEIALLTGDKNQLFEDDTPEGVFEYLISRKDFRPGAAINVKRSSGEVEGDWKISELQTNGYIKVEKPDPDNEGYKLNKLVSLTDADALNPLDSETESS